MAKIDTIRPVENFTAVPGINRSSKEKQLTKRKASRDNDQQKHAQQDENETDNYTDSDEGDSPTIDFCA